MSRDLKETRARATRTPRDRALRAEGTASTRPEATARLACSGHSKDTSRAAGE